MSFLASLTNLSSYQWTTRDDDVQRWCNQASSSQNLWVNRSSLDFENYSWLYGDSLTWCIVVVAPASKVLRFRLSNPPNNDAWYVFPASTAGMFLDVQDMDELYPHCDHLPHQFGMCHRVSATLFTSCIS